MNKTTKQYKKTLSIFTAIFLSFLMTKYISSEVFIADTPQINPQFIANLRAIPIRAIAYVRHPFNSQERASQIETAQIPQTQTPQGLVFSPVAKGVHAAEDPQTGKSYMKIEKGTKLQVYEIKMSDGQTVKVYVPVE